MKRFLVAALLLAGCSSSSPPLPAPPPLESAAPGDQTATLAGGCFWALQSEFQRLRGVHQVTAGYAGGSSPNPSYEQVGSGQTGHAESIQIKFDPKVISYSDLLHIFLTDIDPTTVDRQGNDSGPQYRSVIFAHDAEQRKQAQQEIARVDASHLYKDPIVTQVTDYTAFYPAEDYHQNYFEHNPNQPYCASVVAPEMERFLKLNKDRLKPST